MPRNRATRLGFALVVLVLLGVIGRNAYHRDLNNRLIAAVEQKNVAAVRNLLARGADPNSRQPPKKIFASETPVFGPETPVLDLVLNTGTKNPREDEEIACLLIQHGAAIHGKYTEDYLVNACRRGYILAARCLLEHGVDPNAADSFSDTPLEAATNYITFMPAGATAAQQEAARQQTRLRKSELARLLLEHGARLNLWQAARIDDVDTLHALLDAGTPVDERQPDTHTAHLNGPTALGYAAETGSLQAARLLLQRGANVNIQGDYPLIGAILGEHLDVARLLLQHGANANPDVNPSGLLLVIASIRLPQLVPELLQHGADLNIRGYEETVNRQSSLTQTQRTAERNKEIDRCKMLLRQIGHSNLKPGWGALQTAIVIQPDLVPLLLSHKADAHETARQKDSLLWYVIHHGRKELIVPLLRAGANVNAQHSGVPPLMEAMQQDTQLVKLLLDSGADPNIVLQTGQTPLIAVTQARKLAVARLLLAYRANVNGKGRLGHTPLYFARRRKDAPLSALLEQAGGKEE